MERFSLRTAQLLVAVALLYSSCADQETLAPENAHLSFTLDAVRQDLPVNAMTILITLESKEGEEVIDHELTLHRSGDRYVSDHLDLESGNYTVTGFMVVTGTDVVYATPLKRSELGSAMSRALPYTFSWNRQTSLDIALPIIDTRNKKPEVFGYRSFSMKANPFKVEVLIPGNNGLERTSAQAIVLNGLDTLKRFHLQAKMNNLIFKGDPSETYTLTIVKDNYSRYSQEVRFMDLKHSPVSAVLDPALTLIGIPAAGNHYFALEFDAWGFIDYNVDWGDGTTETWSSGITTVLDHHYGQPGKYFITISGDAVDSVVWVGNFFSKIERISMDHLINLFDFRMENVAGPKIIKLPNSPHLSDVRINRTMVEEIIIPDDGSIYLLELWANPQLKPESFNELIRDIHHQVTNKPRAGEILYYVEEGNYDEPTVQPSPEAVQHLLELKHIYNWFLIPDPDLL